MSDPLLELEDLTVQYETESGPLTAVSDASFSVHESEYFGLAGESGCGKSTVLKAIIAGGLPDNGNVTSGKIRYKGREIQDLSYKKQKQIIGWDEVSYIPQSSMNSLDELQRINEQAIEIAQTYTDLSKQEITDKLKYYFNIVGIQEGRVTDYPHQFSGGMEQRAIIAIALLLEPSLIIADEPTTALDVIMQDQIMKYYDKVKEETDTSLLLITHDISLIMETCERFAIMHSGQIAEIGPTIELYDSPRHPYSILLQESFPDIRHRHKELEVIEGTPPQTIGDVDYCTFADRCPWAIEECTQGAPELEPIQEDQESGREHLAACIRKDEAYKLYEEEENIRQQSQET